MKSFPLDIENPAAICAFAAQVSAAYPALNVLVNNAGIMRAENLLAQQSDLSDAEAVVATNLLGPIRLTAALMAHLLKQPKAVIVNVSSGLAFLPMAQVPAYCATKAAIHSYSQSLRHQLKETAVEVLELIPPYVATDLMGGADDPHAMPLANFIAEVMEILKNQPSAVEICVENAKIFRFSAENGKYDAIFQKMNAAQPEIY
jgi:uncharacterized oxidoreductase